MLHKLAFYCNNSNLLSPTFKFHMSTFYIFFILVAFYLVLVLSFLTELSSLLGPSGFWRLALPVGVCSLEYNNNNNAYVARVIEMLQENTVDLFHCKTCYKPQSKVLDKSTPYKDHVIGLKCGSSQTNFNSEIL